MDKQSIVLLGHSLLIDGVAATLNDRPGLHLVHIDADSEKSAQCIRSLHPDLVIFELELTRIQPLLDLLEEQSNLLFVGIHPEYSRLVILGRHQPLATMQELISMLDEMVAHSTPISAPLPPLLLTTRAE